MRNKKWLLLPLAALVASIYLSFIFSNATPLVLSATIQSDGGYKFNIPASTANNQFTNSLPYLSGPNHPYYWIFLNLDDGHYFKGNLADLDNFVYYYQKPGNYYPYAEATPVYDDNTIPPAPAAGVSVPPFIAEIENTQPITITTVPTVPTDFSPGITLNPNQVDLDCVREVVPSHDITYIIEFKAPSVFSDPTATICDGTLNFTFDANLLTYKGGIGYAKHPTAGTNYDIIPISTANNQISIATNSMGKEEQRTIFLKFETKSTAQGGERLAAPTVQFTCCASPADAGLPEQNMVKTSHDPNQKLVNKSVINTQGEYLEYHIVFQNDGFNEVNEVWINDEISDLLVPTFYAVKFNRNSVPSPAPIGPGKYQWHLTGLNIPGLHQKGLGKTFSEEDTKGHLTYQIQIKNPLLPCGAILNRAEIIFGCNPPLYTTLASTTIRCPDTSTEPDTMRACENLQKYTLDTLIIPITGANEHMLSSASAAIASQLNSFAADGAYNWYPAQGLSSTTVQDPVLTGFHNQTYTLVCSKSCEQTIVHVPVKVDCNLDIQVTNLQLNTTIFTNCEAPYNYKLELTALGNYSNANNLVWNVDCVTGKNWSDSKIPPGPYYFSVKDIVTGCYAEKTIILPETKLQVTDQTGDCIADLVVTGGIPPYIYHWRYNSPDHLGVNDVPSGPPNLDMNDKTNVSVTVTDANQCTAVLSPIRNRCNPRTPWWPWVLAGLGLVLGGYLLFQYLRRP